MTRIRLDESTEVQEPVLSEQRSCLKGGCFSSCGCLLMVGILLLLVLRITWGPRTVQLAEVPDYFAAHELVYDAPRAQRISLTRAANVSRVVATATALPRLLYTPARRAYDTYADSGAWWGATRRYAHEVRLIFLSPASGSAHDVYRIVWGHLDDDIATIREFYLDAFEKAGYVTTVKFDNTNTFEIHFSRDDVSGIALIENYDLRDAGIERMTLEVRVPHVP